MSNFFQKRDRWGNGVSLWVFAAILFSVPLAVVALTQLRMNNDVESWLPKHDQGARELAWFKQHFPSQDTVLITWDDSTLQDPRVDALTQKFVGTVDPDGVRRNASPYIESVTTAEDTCRKLIEYGVEPEEAIRRLTGTLIGHGLINIKLTDVGQHQRRLAIKRLTELGAKEFGVAIEVTEPIAPRPAPEDRPLDWEAEEPPVLAEEASFAEAEEDPLRFWTIPPHDFRVTWRGMESWSADVDRFCELAQDVRGLPTKAEPEGARLISAAFQSPGSPVGMLVTLSEAGRADEGRAIREIRAAAEAVGIPPASLRMGGRAVTTSELNAAVKDAAWNTSCGSWWPHKRSVIMLSGAVGIAMAFAFLKSLRLGILVLAISYYSTMISTALVPLFGDNMNMVLMVMPTLLNVTTLSGAIHVANYWKHSAVEDPRTAVARAVAMARQPCALASITTAIGLISLVTSQLGPVRQFGFYSAIGCLIALVMVLYALPAMLQIWPGPAPTAREVNSRFWQDYGRRLTRHRLAVALGCMVLVAFCSYGLTYFRTETKVIRYFPSNARVVRDSEAIEQSFAGISPVETVVRFSPEFQRETTFLQRMEIVREVGESLRNHPEISGVISLADFQPEVHAPPEDAGTFAKIKYNRRSSEVERRIKSAEVPGTETLLAVAASPAQGATAIDGVEPQEGEELWRLTAQASMISDTDFTILTDELNERVRSVLSAYPGVQHVVTGTVPLFLRTQMAVLESLIYSFAMSFGIITIMMIFQLRNVFAGLWCMLPNVTPVCAVFGLMSWCGARVDVGSMVTASVALGIAVDGTLHLLTWFSDGIRRGMTRSQAVRESLAHCGPAMWQTSAAICFGLLMLYPADLLMISRFGWLMAALIAVALFGDLVFLPALLMGPLGALIQRTIAKQGSAGVPAPSLVAVEPPSAPHFEVTKDLRHRLSHSR